MRKKLEWIGKPLKYGTRHIVAGDVEYFSAKHAKLFVKAGLARKVREPVDLPPPPAGLLARFDGNGVPAQSPDLSTLRAEYTAKLGKRPFMGWDAQALAKKIAEA